MQKRVLVVDDIPINCKVLSMHLTKLGIACDTASNGEEAVAACTRTRYTMILMDLDMPVMNGFEATKLIRQYEHARGVRTPILAVSSFDSIDDRQKCIREGMDGFLQKGVNGQELLSVIQSYDLEDTATRMPAVSAQRAARQEVGLAADLEQLKLRFDTQTNEVVSEFVFCARSLMDDFLRVIATRDAMQLTHVSYSLKGSASSLGLLTMATLCAEIADDGYAGHWSKVSRKYRTLAGMLAQVQEVVSTVPDVRVG